MVDLAALAAETGTPLYVYDAPRVLANLDRLRRALGGAVRHGRVFYAMKSNRHVPLLMALRQHGGCGIDVCSPGELDLARECGFAAAEISHTGTALSAADAAALARHADLTINCDSRAGLRQIAQAAPGRRVGLRIDPELGIGYRQNPRLLYAGRSVSKFGIPLSELNTAITEAKTLGLTVDGLHVHAGCGFLTPQLPVYDRILERLATAAATIPGLRYVNLGGGLGIPLVRRDAPLDLAAWAAVVKRHFGRARHEVWIEPGDYVAKDAGVLLLEVTGVEKKSGEVLVGVNGGFNLHPEPVFYDLPLEPVPVLAPSGRKSRLILAGNINEAHDVWARDVRLPLPEPGDVWAFLNAGGYGAAMASDHCRRGTWKERLLWS